MTETYTPDNLFAGQVMPVVSGKMVIASGAGALARGTVLGKITASKKGKAVDSGQADGSEKPYAILAETVDATSGDVETTVYLTGEYNKNALVFGGTDTVATHEDSLRQLGIFAKDTVSA